MEVSRRALLKVLGIGVAGLAVRPLLDVLVKPRGAEAAVRAAETSTTKRWAMVVDVRACLQNDGCTDCIEACHHAHNVPDLGSTKEEIKWLWHAPYEKVFSEQGPELIEETTRTRGVVEKCNFCAERLSAGLLPACVEACPEGALTFGDFSDPDSDVRKLLRSRHVMQRLPELGTKPNVYYVL